MARLAINSNEQRPLSFETAGNVLQRGHVLVGVQRHHAVIVIRRRDEHGWVNLALHVVKWRYLDLVVKRALVAAAVLGGPRVPNGELLETQQVGDWHLADDAGVEVGSLVGAGCYEEASVRAALHDECFVAGEAAGMKVLGSTNKIIEAILLFFFDASLVPLLTEFSSATNVRQSEDSVHVVQENQAGNTEVGRHGDAEATVAVEECWCRLLDLAIDVWKQALFPHDEHGNFGSVLAFIPNLIGFEE